MHHRSTPGLVCCVLLLGALLSTPCLAERKAYAGRTLSSVLAELSDPGMRLIYSSELVPDSLLVLREPKHRDRLRLTRELLAQHGLVASTVRGDLYVILRGDSRMQAQITGTVVDAESGVAVPIARVELQPLGLARVTDTHGGFSFGGVPASNYTLRVVAPDYASVETPLAARSGNAPESLTVHLSRAALAEVVVAASRYQLGLDAGGAAFRLPRSQLTAQPSVGEDPLRSASRLPGFASDGISAPPNIRGGSVDEVLVLLDGFPLRRVYHLPGYQSLFSVLDENIIEAADIYTGGFDARYGNRMSGVFDLTSIAASNEPRRSVGVSFVNAHGRWSETLGNGNGDVLLAARVGTLAPVVQRLSPDNGAPRYSDAFARLVFDLTPQLTTRLSVLTAEDELRINDEDERAEYESAANYLWLRTDWAPSDVLNASLWIGRSKFDLSRLGDIDKEDYLVGGARDIRHAVVTDLHAAFAWQAHEDHQVSLGLEWARMSASYDYQGEAQYGAEIAELFARPQAFARASDFEIDSHRFAAYVSDRWRMGNRWTTELGLRAQRVSYTGGPSESTLEPRFGLRVSLAPSTLLRLHWGKFYQADEASDLHVEDGVIAPQPARRSDHLIVGLEHEWRNGLHVRAEAFRKREFAPRLRFENSLTRLELLPELAPDRVAIAPNTAEITGIETSLSYERESWRTWLSVARSVATDEFVVQEVSRSWDQSWAAQTGIEWQRGPWSTSAAFSWHRGWPTTAITTDADGNAQLGVRNAARLPSFAALDLRGEYRRPVAMGSLVITLEISNATNRRNQCCTEIEVEDDARRRARHLWCASAFAAAPAIARDPLGVLNSLPQVSPKRYSAETFVSKY